MRLNYILCLFAIIIILSESKFINYHNNLNKNKQLCFVKSPSTMKLFNFNDGFVNDHHKIQTIMLLILLHYIL